MKGRERIIAALDVPDPAAAAALASKLAGRVGLLKVGLELFVAHGRAALDAVAAQGLPVFLDLKLHDIPQTVESAARGAGALGAALVTVHASGGAAMVAAAKRGLQQGAREAGRPAPRLLAVTVLTSLSDQDLQAVGLGGPSREAALRLGLLAVRAGADGLVCSPAEVEALRAAIGRGPLLVVPGIRPAGAAKGDQQRTGTPAEAVRAGADYLVVGRPLRDAPDPGAAADAIAAEIDG
ncbi:MAG: orotidine-5'-phosphate decarboxylase [Myxococcales bacterium]